MRCYLDSSVVLRVVLGQEPVLDAWASWSEAYASRLVRLECHRVVDRLRLAGDLDDEGRAAVHEDLAAIEAAYHEVALTEAVMDFAERPMPTAVGTLDSVHVATAKLLSEKRVPDLVFATHDLQQARAARALGLPIVGVD